MQFIALRTKRSNGAKIRHLLQSVCTSALGSDQPFAAV